MTYWTSTKNICTSCTWFVNSNMPSWGAAIIYPGRNMRNAE